MFALEVLNILISARNKAKAANSKINICDALHNLVPFVQFKKREKHP